MGVLHNGKERLENLLRKTRMERSKQKKRPPRKRGKVSCYYDKRSLPAGEEEKNDYSP